jgi:coiled-coil domain-containing protein 6
MSSSALPQRLTNVTPRGSALGAVPSDLNSLSRESLIELVLKLKRDCETMRTERDQLALSLDAEEEQISNRLMRRVNELKAEKELLAQQVDSESEMVATRLNRQVTALRQEKVNLENELEAEEESMTNKLQRQIADLEARNAILHQQLESTAAELVAVRASAEHRDKKLRRDEHPS